MDIQYVDFSGGHEKILEALVLTKEENDISAKISSLLNSVLEDQSHTITSICKALALQCQQIEKKEKLAETLDQISKWWGLLADDREKLLLTISNLEMEKEAIQKSRDDPREIYHGILEMEKNPRSDLHNLSSISLDGVVVNREERQFKKSACADDKM